MLILKSNILWNGSITKFIMSSIIQKQKINLPTDHLGGKMTKSATAVPGFAEGQVNTVKMLGSMWSKLKKNSGYKSRRHTQMQL